MYSNDIVMLRKICFKVLPLVSVVFVLYLYLTNGIFKQVELSSPDINGPKLLPKINFTSSVLGKNYLDYSSFRINGKTPKPIPNSDQKKETIIPTYDDKQDTPKPILNSTKKLVTLKSISNSVGKPERPNVTHDALKTNQNNSTERSDFDTRLTPDIIKDLGNQTMRQSITKAEQKRPVYIIWSKWRSGTTFLGELLSNVQEDTFYSYEPLHPFNVNVYKRENEDTKFMQEFILNISECNYDPYWRILNYFVALKYFIHYNPMTNKACKNIERCKEPAIMNDICNKSNLHVMKILRLSLKFAEFFLKSKPNMKIIYLVRDPRPVIHSRFKTNFCFTRDCIDTATICQIQLEEINYARELLIKYPERFIFLRYEDLASDPIPVFKNLWETLGQNFTLDVKRIVEKYTTNIPNGEKQNNSKGVAFAWRSRMDYKTIVPIQEICKDPMDILGYRSFLSKEDYGNHSVPVLFTIKI